jgi:hypothetical protein
MDFAARLLGQGGHQNGNLQKFGDVAPSRLVHFFGDAALSHPNLASSDDALDRPFVNLSCDHTLKPEPVLTLRIACCLQNNLVVQAARVFVLVQQCTRRVPSGAGAAARGVPSSEIDSSTHASCSVSLALQTRPPLNQRSRQGIMHRWRKAASVLSCLEMNTQCGVCNPMGTAVTAAGRRSCSKLMLCVHVRVGHCFSSLPRGQMAAGGSAMGTRSTHTCTKRMAGRPIGRCRKKLMTYNTQVPPPQTECACGGER